MSKNPCGCTEDNCPHRTSEVNLWDGTFTSISVPAGAGLNEVLALLENYILSVGTCNDVNYTLNAFSACLNLPAGTYSFTQIIDAIVARICTNASDISTLQTQVGSLSALTTTNTLLTDIVLPSCFTAFAGTTSTDLFNTILSNLCSLLDDVAPTTGDGGITVTAPDPGTTIDPNGTNATGFILNSRMEHVAEAIKSIVDNSSYIYDHTSLIVSPTSFVVGFTPIRGVIENFLVVRDISEDLTVNASVDTYFFLSGDSSILKREVALAAPAPATPSGSHPLYKAVSDGSGVTSVVVLFTSSALNATPLGTDDVLTINIKDAEVTTAKLAPVNTGSTVGHLSLFLITNNDEGQVTGLASNMTLGGLANGQILTYNSGLNKFENVANTAVTTVGVIPKSNASGDNYTDSVISESASQVLVTKKAEINDVGAAEDNANAILNLVGTGALLMPRLTFTEAGALPLTDGFLIYVISTDATFTSVGFWGVENSVWVKL